jgi:ABC-type uncharacterized transport system permease subunit
MYYTMRKRTSLGRDFQVPQQVMFLEPAFDFLLNRRKYPMQLTGANLTTSIYNAQGSLARF